MNFIKFFRMLNDDEWFDVVILPISSLFIFYFLFLSAVDVQSCFVLNDTNGLIYSVCSLLTLLVSIFILLYMFTSDLNFKILECKLDFIKKCLMCLFRH